MAIDLLTCQHSAGMGKSSKRGRSRLGLALSCVLAGSAGVVLANCSSTTVSGSRRPDDSGAGECNPGDTRKCIGPGACSGGQKCGLDSHWKDCDCGTIIIGAAGAVSTGGHAGQGGAGGVLAMTGGIGNGGLALTGGTGGLALTGGTGPTLPDACAPVDVQPPSVPIDMYIMFDQSQSMSTMVTASNPPITWWTAAQQALTRFVQDPSAAGIGVGIQFFPYHGLVAGTDPSSPSSSCNIQNYETPEVEIGALPANATAIVASIQAHAPTTFTPTAAALEGAVRHMQAWGPAHPGRQPAVVLVTDGFPTECDPQDPSLIAQLAKTAYDGTPRIMTFVVGFQDGEALDNLGQIAKAGGTGNAILIKDGDIGKQFVDAMLAISRTPIDCAFDIPSTTPAGDPVDLKRVWLEYVSQATLVPQTIPSLANLGQCASAADGWYFDAPPPASQKILLCPQTCQKIPAGAVHLKLGCLPVTVP